MFTLPECLFIGLRVFVLAAMKCNRNLRLEIHSLIVVSCVHCFPTLTLIVRENIRGQLIGHAHIYLKLGPLIYIIKSMIGAHKQ